MKEWAALLIGLSVAAFVLNAVGLQIRVSLVWLGVAFLVAGVYLIPAL